MSIRPRPPRRPPSSLPSFRPFEKAGERGRDGARDKPGDGAAPGRKVGTREEHEPVTLRLDADVLAWFKRDGRRYQTRINSALRRVMEREMKAE